jgi:hypothetical protein
MSDQNQSGTKVNLPSAGKEFIVPKLKAGKYYEAQKVYVSWIQELQKVFSTNNVDLEQIKNEDGTVDPEKLQESLTKNTKIDTSSILDQVGFASDKRTELLSICLGKTKEEILEEFFPDDLELIVEKVLEVNNFLGNIKKSVAPMVGLGLNQEKKTTPQ